MRPAFDLNSELERKSADDVAYAIRGFPPAKQLQIIRQARAELVVRQKDLANQEAELIDMRAALAAAEDVKAWRALESYTLERNDCSRLHRLAEAFIHNRIVGPDDFKDPLSNPARHALWQQAHPFVVRHDWSAALQGAQDFDDGDWKLPYETCAFEFRLSGRNVIVIGWQMDGARGCIGFAESGDYWFTAGEEDKEHAAFKFAWDQARAICISLEANVSEHTVVRAPAALNAKREREGKVPLFDYSVVDLARRHRVKNPLAHSECGKKRLHFRRGHWRHFAEFKTWVRWTLVGDPSLGFIDKQYRI